MPYGDIMFIINVFSSAIAHYFVFDTFALLNVRIMTLAFLISEIDEINLF